MTDAEHPTDPPEGADQSRPTESPDKQPDWSSLRQGLRMVLGLLLVAALVFGGISAWKWKQATDLESARREALTTARADAVLIASYDYRKIDAYFKDLRKIATGEFAKQYIQANTDLRNLIKKLKSEVEATVLNAAVESATENQATVLLFVDQAAKNSLLRDKATDRNRMRMTLVLKKGKWMVSKLELK